MDQIWFTAALWLGLALVAALFGSWLRASMALTEIMGILAQFLLDAIGKDRLLGASEAWVIFLASAGSSCSPFLQGLN
ncbi:MAG: hypothetical protein QN189_03875 [Armatimonadota bacterium]|nr:hypothetical protein [Armatimonadota bacterium]